MPGLAGRRCVSQAERWTFDFIAFQPCAKIFAFNQRIFEQALDKPNDPVYTPPHTAQHGGYG
ncbi:hypothetical protein PMI09_05715 [Rhizobium sp. CF122]|nr:hypothetical protein PMI09_05715 [Rhizobium sp. CF122]MBB3396209.1 hypothetical protein [Rhizobium sp. BK060]MBB4172047.1 hypothetical protein [Rhizobium sp. BK538]TCM61934.1 hypothetical protein EV291_15518 [Rhizobium sp. BK068]